MREFTGTGVALVTPFDEHFQIDQDSLRKLVNHVIAGGVDFLVALGTTAECATLTSEEKAEIIDIITEVNNGRLPVMAGIGGNNTREVIRELKEAAWLEKCQAVLSITPFYNKPSQQGLYEHFKVIAQASSLPICLYNVPGRTGVNMTAETTARLSQNCPNILGIKEASGCMNQATRLMKTKRADFKAISGDDAIVLPLMALGFEGVISVIANLVPDKCASLVNNICRNDFSAAREIHMQLSNLCTALFEQGNPAGIKAALHACGIIRCNTLRLPLTPITEELYCRIRQMVRL